MEWMSGDRVLNWALIALSSFNTIIPVWLGLTVLLNAERRAWGIWLAGCSLLVSGVFFIFHTLLLEGSLFYFRLALGPVWDLRWIPIVALPLAWYSAMLWFAGFWEKSAGALHRFHRPALIFTVLLGISVMILLLVSDRLTGGGAIGSSSGSSSGSDQGGIPAQLILYPFYIICCFLFSLHALRNVEPSGRMMGDLARVRARPWLRGTTLLLIAVSLLVAWALFWVVVERGEPVFTMSDLLALHWFDFGISFLIASAILSLGQAIVSYEIFTGKILPRQGFRRHWHNAIVLAAGYSAMLSLALVLDLPPIYSLLIATVLIALFYALLNWRSFAERDRYLEHLRPFIGSQQLYELLLGRGGEEIDSNVSVPFRALCTDVLGARVGFLVPLGPMATLAGPVLSYPVSPPDSLADRSGLVSLVDSPRTLSVQVEPGRYGGAVWAIPLWSERGLIGVLLLGEKLDGGLYTQEEMEIARASGERLVDMQAGVEMARRLMELQRRRLAESQVIDQQTRRVLHDDVLPQLHAVMLELSGGSAAAREAVGMMSDLHRKISDLLRELPAPASQAVERLGFVGALRHVATVEFRNGFDEVRWECDPEAETLAATLSPLAADVTYYAARESIRNAARYGRGGNGRRPLHLSVRLDAGSGLEITIEDDGVGIDAAVPSSGGSGQGLALHSTMMAVVGGSLAIESVPDRYTRVRLRVSGGGK